MSLHDNSYVLREFEEMEVQFRVNVSPVSASKHAHTQTCNYYNTDAKQKHGGGSNSSK
jgi:hypothetical protein